MLLWKTEILVRQELTKRFKRKGGKPKCLIKIDLRKAYDSISWAFIEEMPSALQFPKKYINWVMACITTPYSLMINGDLCGFFSGKRGIRQGDPISPLLFVICMEYLSRLFKYVSTLEGFKFYRSCRDLRLCHLCFADDFILFSEGDYFFVLTLLRGCETFLRASGLQANKAKSRVIC